MAGLFDKLQNKLEDQDSGGGGITPIDLVDLPPSMRKVMRMMLRKITLTHEQVHEMIAKMPKSRSMPPDELDEALVELTNQGWLMKMGEEDRISYRVNLRRKRASSLGSGIWGNLNDRLVRDRGPKRREKPAEDAAETTTDSETATEA